MAELSGPFPPGDYPVVVVGSGPGALQVSYSLRRLGVDHAVISSDPSPGGMFRRWPFFQRLLSWTKPHAPAARGSPTYERYDWNSLLGDEPDTCALQPSLMDGSSYFPSRPEMEANLALFAERARIEVRYGTRWTGTRQVSTPDGDRFEVETTDGTYTARVLVIAVGVAEPYTPPGIGMEHTHHYADVRPVQEYADRRVLIIGKQNSGFELASGLLPWARQLIVVVTVEGPAVGRYQDAGRCPRQVRPAVRGLRPRRWGQRARRRDRPDRADRRRAADRPPATDRRRRGPRDRGRRRHLGDRLRVPARRPARARGHDLRRQQAARPDALVGERHRPRHLLRRDDRPGVEGPPEARRAGELGRGPWRALQRARARRLHRADVLRRRSGAADRGARRRRPGSWRPSWPSRPSSSTSAATSPASWPPTDRAGSATRASSHSPTCSTPTARTCSRRRSRRTAPGPSTRCCTPGSAGEIVEQTLETDPLMRFDTTDARRMIGEMAARITSR